MRTGAIFARGSCRALKWMALVGMVLALGSGQVLAQTIESAHYNVTGTGVSVVTIKMSATVQASGNGDIFGDFELGRTDGTATSLSTSAADEFTVTFGADTISGTPTLTYTPSTTAGDPVIEDSGGRDVGTLSATVMPATPEISLVANQPAQLGVEFSLVLPAATGGVGDITYTIPAFGAGTANEHTAGELPEGLDFDGDDRMITGEPEALGRFLVTYTATDDAADELTTASGNHSGSVNFYIEVGTAPTRIDTTGEVTGVSVGGAEEVTIAGDKRLHVDEGDFTEVEVEVTWNNAQLTQLWAAKTGDKPDPAMVKIEASPVTGTGSAADWLSPAEIGHDVILGSAMVEVAIPAAPTTQKDSTRVDVKGTGSVTLTLGPDTDAEEEGFSITVTGMAGATDDAETRTIVIEDDENQGVKLVRTTKGNIFEGGSDIVFTATPDPPRENLDLKVRYDLTDIEGQSVSSRLYSVDSSEGLIGTGAGAKDTVTLNLAANDGDREDDALQMHAEVVSYDLSSGAFDDIGTASVDFTVIDVHKLPPLMVSPSTGTVAEGGMIELTLTLDRNPANTIVTDDEKRQQTAEAVDVMLKSGAGTSAGMGDYQLPATVEFEKHNGKAPWVQEMKVEVMALEDNDLDDMEMLVLDAEVAGTTAANGREPDEYMAVSTLTISEGTMKLVSPKTDEEIQEVIYAAKEAGMGADMMFNPGEMIEIESAGALFNAAEGVTLSYSAMSDNDDVATVAVSGGMVTVTAGDMPGVMAHITITAHASMPAGAKGLPQTDPREASVIFPVEVGLAALSIVLSGPDDMNLAEGGMGGMVTATANRMVTADTKVTLMRDRSKSSADDMDFEADPITILAGQMSGSTMVMAVEDDMMEDMEELVLYGMTEGMEGEVTGEVMFYLWDAAVPALPIIGQLLLAAFLALGGYRRYRRR